MEGTASFSPSSFKLNLVVAHSVNRPLLEFTKVLLAKQFKIDSELKRSKTAGLKDSVINGRVITRTKDLYTLSIGNFEDQKKYAKSIGFCIQRQKLKLADAIFLLKNLIGEQPATYGMKHITKKGGFGFEITALQ